MYEFCQQPHCADGTGPFASLIQGFNGNFYGTTVGGGAKGYCPVSRCGTVFEITPQGALTTLYSFCAQPNCADGTSPYAGVVQDAEGNFYGTTISGGTGAYCPFGVGGCGTVFKLTAQGSLTTIHSFCSQQNCTDGYYPGRLIQAEDGNFYGGTSNDGDHGTIFKITPQGVLTTLYTFCVLSNCADGDVLSSLIQANGGNFYGTTVSGGTSNNGTAFELTSGGQLTTLYNFCPQGGKVCLDGYEPGGLVQDTNGSLYGETYEGGAAGYGTAFSLSVGLPAFIETQPSAGSIGSSVVILGTNLTGASSVTFNSVAAAFTVVSSTEITATVPSGATTGPVYVTTTSGTLKSNKNFHVAP
ncbi:MAG TPA: choice-of-anchor tandem repeat GloVer-containing protein [Terriglobia bacterium]|nr:choice-of-anchor tandem repeat GloVer-containing protein [Terriglobia bacterium]